MAATCAPAKTKKKAAAKKAAPKKKAAKPEKGAAQDAKDAKGAKGAKDVKKKAAAKKKTTKKKACDTKKTGPRTTKATPTMAAVQARMTASPGEPTYRLPGYAPRQQQTPVDRAILRLQPHPSVPSAGTALRRSLVAGL